MRSGVDKPALREASHAATLATVLLDRARLGSAKDPERALAHAEAHLQRALDRIRSTRPVQAAA